MLWFLNCDCLHYHFSWLVYFGQSRVEVSASLINIGSLAVGAFDLGNCCLSVVRFIPIFHVGQ